MEESEAVLKWQGWIREQAESGKSVAGFCRERKVNRQAFFRWRKRLKAARVSKAAGFIEMSAAEEPRKVLRITTPGGYGVEVPLCDDKRADEGLFLRVLGALR